MTDFAPTIRMHHATRAKAERLATMFEMEYPALTLEAVNGDHIDHPEFEFDLCGFEVLHDGEVVLESSKVPELADVFEACAEMGIDPAVDGEEEEEDERSGSIVPNTYRAVYREVSTTGQSCGDWLAERLAIDTLSGGKLRMADLIATFERNRVDLGAKWATVRFAPTPGWQGRFRMSGRIALEKRIALNGTYASPSGPVITPHADWLDKIRTKHAKWLAKMAKAD